MPLELELTLCHGYPAFRPLSQLYTCHGALLFLLCRRVNAVVVRVLSRVSVWVVKGNAVSVTVCVVRGNAVCGLLGVKR